jgi:hypothetical protein
MSVPTRAVWSRHEVAIQPGRCHAARQLLCRPGRCTSILDGPPPASKFTPALREALVRTPLNQIMRPSHCPSSNVAVAARDAPRRLLADGMVATDTIARSSAINLVSPRSPPSTRAPISHRHASWAERRRQLFMAPYSYSCYLSNLPLSKCQEPHAIPKEHSGALIVPGASERQSVGFPVLDKGRGEWPAFHHDPITPGTECSPR